MVGVADVSELLRVRCLQHTRKKWFLVKNCPGKTEATVVKERKRDEIPQLYELRCCAGAESASKFHMESMLQSRPSAP